MFRVLDSCHLWREPSPGDLQPSEPVARLWPRRRTEMEARER